MYNCTSPVRAPKTYTFGPGEPNCQRLKLYDTPSMVSKHVVRALCTRWLVGRGRAAQRRLVPLLEIAPRLVVLALPALLVLLVRLALLAVVLRPVRGVPPPRPPPSSIG